MSSTMTQLKVAGQLAFRVISRRLRKGIEPTLDLAAFSSEMEAVLAQASDSLVRSYRWILLPADQPPWVDAKVQLAEGDEASYFAFGRVYANHFLDIYITPALQLWCKLGDTGEIFRGTRDSHSFRASHAGQLLFGNSFPNDWADLQGARKESDDVYRQVSGELKILVICWNGTALEGLRALREIALYFVTGFLLPCLPGLLRFMVR